LMMHGQTQNKLWYVVGVPCSLAVWRPSGYFTFHEV